MASLSTGTAKFCPYMRGNLMTSSCLEHNLPLRPQIFLASCSEPSHTHARTHTCAHACTLISNSIQLVVAGCCDRRDHQFMTIFRRCLCVCLLVVPDLLSPIWQPLILLACCVIPLVDRQCLMPPHPVSRYMTQLLFVFNPLM